MKLVKDHSIKFFILVNSIDYIQGGREISAIIVTDDYLRFKEPKTPYNFFLFQYLTNYLSLKLRTNENTERRGALLWTERTSTFCLRSHRDPFAFFKALARFSDQRINDISSTT